MINSRCNNVTTCTTEANTGTIRTNRWVLGRLERLGQILGRPGEAPLSAILNKIPQIT